MVPVEPNPRSALLNPVRALKGGEMRGDALKHGPSALRKLDGLPVALHLFRSGDTDCPEDVRMSPDELGGDSMENLVHGEFASLFSDRCLQDDMQKEIAELRPEIIEATSVQRIDHLIRLLYQAVSQRAVRLLPVPRAFLPEFSDDANETTKFSRRDCREC
jgi:hypothetical protein